MTDDPSGHAIALRCVELMRNERRISLAEYAAAVRVLLEAMLCEDCGKFPADYPSKLCPGCQVYREHTGAL